MKRSKAEDKKGRLILYPNVWKEPTVYNDHPIGRNMAPVRPHSPPPAKRRLLPSAYFHLPQSVSARRDRLVGTQHSKPPSTRRLQVAKSSTRSTSHLAPARAGDRGGETPCQMAARLGDLESLNAFRCHTASLLAYGAFCNDKVPIGGLFGRGGLSGPPRGCTIHTVWC